MEELVKIMIKSDEEEVLKKYPSRNISSQPRTRRKPGENPQLDLKSL